MIHEADQRSIKSHLINALDVDGESALHIALRREGEPSNKSAAGSEFEALVADVQASGLVPAIFTHPVAIAAYLITHGAKSSIRNKAGLTPLEYLTDANIRLFLTQIEQNTSDKAKKKGKPI